MERSKRRLLLRAGTMLVSLLAPHAASWGQMPAGQAPDQAFRLGSGIVVGAAGAELFLMRPAGGIEAVSTELGQTIWTSSAAARPIAMQGDLLLAQAETTGRADKVGLVLLESRRGDAVRGMNLELPTKAWAGIDDGLGATFAVEAWTERDDLLISWACREQVIGGAHLDRPAPRQEVGLARLKPSKGQLENLAPGVVSPPAAPQLLAPPAKRLAAVAGRQFLSVDGRHILASERLAGDAVLAKYSDDTYSWEKYRWTLFDRASGERLGQVDSRWSMTEFFVTGNLLVHRAPAYQRRQADGNFEHAPLSVRAIDLASGTELWRRSVRDTKYRGPFPP